MSFLSDRDFIIGMDLTKYNGGVFTDDELKQLHGVGVQTMLWVDTAVNDFMHDDFRTFNWKYFDRYIERMRQAEMKCIIVLFHFPPTFYPRSYYIRRADAVDSRSFSPWNQEAQDKWNDLLRLVIKRLASNDVLFITGQCEGGERVLLNEPAYYDDYALQDWRREHEGRPDHRTPEGAAWLRQSYMRLVKTQAEIFLEQPNREIWFALSRAKPLNPNISCHGCEWYEDYLDIFKALNPTSINHFSYNYFPFGPDYWRLMQRDRAWGVNEFPGAEYAHGLRDGFKLGDGTWTKPTHELAIEHGLRGMLCGPCHPFTGATHLYPWMVGAIGKAHRAFEEAQNWRNCQ